MNERIPRTIVVNRTKACLACATPCVQISSPYFRESACSECPLEEKRWKKFGACGDTSMGLGDLVHAVANPIAKAIDAVAGTNIQGCGGCAKRREYLNSLTKPKE